MVSILVIHLPISWEFQHRFQICLLYTSIRENTRKRFTEVAVAVEEIGNSMTLTLKVLAEGKHKKSSLGVF